MPPPSPTVARLELASTLRSRRREIGRDARTVFEELSVSRNHLSAIENARTLPTDKTLAQLIEVLDCEPDDAAHLVLLLDIARQQGWWDSYSRYVPEPLLELCGIEHGAQGLRIFDPMVVTGLLQTEEYARAMFSTNPENSRRRIARYLEIRMRRQARLRPPDPLQIVLIQGESSLHQEIGGRDVLREQLKYILQVLEEDDVNIEYRIQPFSTSPAGIAIGSTTVIFEFETRYLGGMAWTESPIHMGITSDPEQVEAVELNFELALETSLEPDASLELVRHRVDALEAKAV